MKALAKMTKLAAIAVNTAMQLPYQGTYKKASIIKCSIFKTYFYYQNLNILKQLTESTDVFFLKD